MASTTNDEPSEQIRALIRRINDAWLKNDPDVLEELFHDDAVIVPPGSRERAVGKRACIDSYRAFAESATVQGFSERDLTVDLWGDTAVATYRFDIDYSVEGEAHRESGRDVLVLAREEGHFRAVWRTVLPLG